MSAIGTPSEREKTILTRAGNIIIASLCEQETTALIECLHRNKISPEKANPQVTRCCGLEAASYKSCTSNADLNLVRTKLLSYAANVCPKEIEKLEICEKGGKGNCMVERRNILVCGATKLTAAVDQNRQLNS